MDVSIQGDDLHCRIDRDDPLRSVGRTPDSVGPGADEIGWACLVARQRVAPLRWKWSATAVPPPAEGQFVPGDSGGGAIVALMTPGTASASTLTTARSDASWNRSVIAASPLLT